jgi:ParB/Sulfiredoxin domain
MGVDIIDRFSTPAQPASRMTTTDQIVVEPTAAPEIMEMIGGYQIHPDTALLRNPTPEEFERLKDDIRQHGLRVPVVLTSDGRILDGRTRVRACAELEIPCATRVATINEMLDPVSFVLSMNAARRHLSQDQAAAIWLQHRDPATAKAEAEAGKATRQANLKKGAARKVHMDPSEMEAPKTPEAAKATKPPVSKSTLKRVKKVARLAPERLDDVAAGKVSANKVLKDEATKKPRKSPGKPLSKRMEYALDIGLPVGIDCLGRFLLEARQAEHEDFPDWIKKSIDLHTKLGAVLALIQQQEPHPTESDLETILNPDDGHPADSEPEP